MKKFSSYILILIMLVGIFSPLGIVYAVDSTPTPAKPATVCTAPNTPPGCTPKDTSYVLLAPLPCDPANPVCDPNSKTLIKYDPTGAGGGSISSYLNLMIRIFIGICAVLAVIMIVVGGLQYMTTELISSKEEGQERIKGAIFGLVLALGAWTILYQINPHLLDADLTSLKDATVIVDIQDTAPQAPNASGLYSNGMKQGDRLIGTKSSLPDGVTPQTGECTTVGQIGCLSTIGLDTSALKAIVDGCKCGTITLTEGTATWQHGGQSGRTTHGRGSSTVDIKGSSALDTYLSGGKPLVKFTRYGNGAYYYEGNHWHIGP